MKRWLALLLALLMLLPAAKSEEVPAAWREAVMHVPASAMPSGMEEEGGVYLFLFEDAPRSVQYHVQLLSGDLALTSVQMVNTTMQGAKRATYASKKLERMTRQYYPGAAWVGTYLDRTEGLYRYVLLLMDSEDGQFYRLEYDAASGDIMGYTVREQAQDEDLLTMGQALDKALAAAGQAQPLDILLMKKEGRLVYQVILLVGEEEVHIRVDAQTGEVAETARQAAAWQPAGSSKGSAEPGKAGAEPTKEGAGQRAQPRPDNDDDDDDNDDDDWDDDDDD